MLNLNAQVVLCTISPKNVEQRLLHRATYTNEVVTQGDVLNYIDNQQRFVDFANKSSVATMIIKTDDLNWDEYAKLIFDKVH